MARPNFFCSIEALEWLLEHEPKSERDDIDLTVDLIEAPYLFVYTSDAEAWELKVMQRGELYDHKSGSGVEKGSLRVVKESGEGTGKTSDPVLKDNMGAFFEACRSLSRYICDEQLEPLYDGLDPEEAGILLEADGGKLSARKVEGRERPEMMCDTLFGGTVLMRPYMEDFIERSEMDMMDEDELTTAAEEGDESAMARLAQMYLNGEDEVAQDFEKSARWLEKLAETGNAVAQFNMGLYSAKGCGVTRDFAKAAEWMRRAAENGNEDAPALAERYSKLAAVLSPAEQGDAAAMAELAEGYMSLGGSLDPFGPGEDYKESLKLAQKAVDAGCAAGYWPLALAYEHGRGVEQDDQKAVEYYQKGAELGDPNCQHSYGCRLINGDGVKKDAAQALVLFERSAEQGYALAYQALAHMYETGEGVEPDYDKALEYFEKACEAEPNNAELLRHVGFQYTKLMEVDEAHWLRGVQRAAFWLRRAADLGDMASMHGADMYEKILALHEEGKIPAGTPMGDCMRILSDNGMPEEATPFSPFAGPDWEEQWKQQREEYERKAAKEWLAAHEKELDRGAKIVFADKKFVFDGTPDAELFEEVLAKLAEKGGVRRGAVSGKTDYLVCDPRRAGESKLRNLKEQRVKGRCKDTKVVLAEDFYRALGHDPEPEIRVEESEAAPAAPDPKLNAEAEAFLQTKKRELEAVKRDWNRATKGVREKIMQLVKEGVRPEVSSNRSGNTIGIMLDFNADTSKAEAYVEEVQKKIDAIKRRINKAIREYDEKLTDLNNRGAMPDTMEKVISGMKRWATLERTLSVDLGEDRKKGHPQLSAQSKAIIKKWTNGSVAPATPEARVAWEEKKRREAEEREERKRREAERKAREEAEKKEQERKRREEQRKERERKIALRDAAEERDREELDAFRPVLAKYREQNAGLQERIAVNKYTVAALREDGKVYAVKRGPVDFGWQFQVDCWRDIKAISAGQNHMVGLRADGTVVAVGLNKNGQCDVSEWENITAISAGNAHTVGLKADGTVVCAGVNRRRFSSWKNIVAITSGNYFVLGLRADGTAVAQGYQRMAGGADQVSEWKDVVSIAAGDFAYGVRKDGTVVSSNPRGEDVESWTEVVKLVANDSHVAALRADGTVRARDTPELDWRNIVDIDVSGHRLIGLRADGTAAFLEGFSVSSGRNAAKEVSNWSDLAAVRLGKNDVPIGLLKDGTFVGNTLMQKQKWKIFPPYPDEKPEAPVTCAQTTQTVSDGRPPRGGGAPVTRAQTTQTAQISQPANTNQQQTKKDPKSIGSLLLVIGAIIIAISAIGLFQPYRDNSAWCAPFLVGGFLFYIGYFTVKNQKKK